MIKKFYLLISFWNVKDENREKELIFCLQENLKNPFIDKIYIFWEKEIQLANLLFCNDKITNISFFGYPTYNKFIDYANSNLAGKNIIISNTDIYFDNSLKMLLDYDLSNKVLALTRYNLEKYKSFNNEIWERDFNSQDSWIFSAPLNIRGNEFPEIKIGFLGCDNYFAYELDMAGINVLNPSEDIKTWHIHKEREVVLDIFFNKKSYHLQIFDYASKQLIKAKYLPIEPLKKWKIYTIYSPSHRELYNNWFKKTLKDDFEIVSQEIPQDCRTAKFYSNGWVKAVLNKIPMIFKAIGETSEGGFFIFSDVDVQFFLPIQEEIRKVLSENSKIDIFFQQDAVRDSSGVPYFCTGFFVCRVNSKTYKFWKLVAEKMEKENKGDQECANYIWQEEKVLGLKLDFLPHCFWNPNSGVINPKIWKQGEHLKVFTGAIMHHANWTVGVANKIEQLKYVSKKIQEFTALNKLIRNDFKKKLNGSFWAITTFFNPVGYKSRQKNYKVFRENCKKQGLKLLTVELAFDKRNFELKDGDAEILIQIRGDKENIMWQKEAMLNIGLKKLPKDCDKIAWLDCDVIFKNENWIKETSELLETYCIVQPYSLMMTLDRKQISGDIDFEKSEFDINMIRKKRYSLIYLKSLFNNNVGHPGLAWAGRKEIFDKIGFYDKMILGSADVFMADSFYSPEYPILEKYDSKSMGEDFCQWRKKCFSLVMGNVFYTKGNLIHLWHGKFKNRKYDEIKLLLKDNDFNPLKDITKNYDGFWQWHCDKKILIKSVNKYFYLRNEDNKLSFNEFYNALYILKFRFSLNSIKNIFYIKKDRYLGKIGLKIKKISPKIYEFLIKKKPKWAEPLDM